MQAVLNKIEKICKFYLPAKITEEGVPLPFLVNARTSML